MAAAIAYAQSGHLCLATLHANNSYHAMNRIISFYPLENRPALLQDLAATLKAVISQRLVKNIKGGRSAAVEVLLNTRYTAELIDKGEISEIKEAMEKSMTPGSQTFEQALFKMYKDGLITQGGSAGQCRFRHQPDVADEPVRGRARERGRRSGRETDPAGGPIRENRQFQ